MIKNLLQLDLLKLRSLGNWAIGYLLILLFFVADARFAAIGSIIFFYAAIYVPMSYDEQSKGGYLLCTLPVTRRQIVQAKYLYTLLAIFVVMVLSAGATLLASGISGGRTQSTLPMLPMLAMIGSVFAALMIPLLLYFGTIKSRLWVLCIYGVSVAVATMFSGIANSFDHIIPPISGLAAVIGVIISLAVSYCIAVKLYERRQFTE